MNVALSQMILSHSCNPEIIPRRANDRRKSRVRVRCPRVGFFSGLEVRRQFASKPLVAEGYNEGNEKASGGNRRPISSRRNFPRLVLVVLAKPGAETRKRRADFLQTFQRYNFRQIFRLEKRSVLPSFSVACLPLTCCHDNMLHSDLQVGRLDVWQR